MREWILRPYPHEKLRTTEFLQQQIIAIGWPFIGDAKQRSEERLLELLQEQHPQWSATRVRHGVRCILDFSNEMQTDDLVLVVPKKADYRGYVMLAQVTGDYEYLPALASEKEGFPHQRSVKWIRPRIARNQLPESMESFLPQRGLTLTALEDAGLASHAREVGWISE